MAGLGALQTQQSSMTLTKLASTLNKVSLTAAHTCSQLLLQLFGLLYDPLRRPVAPDDYLMFPQKALCLFQLSVAAHDAPESERSLLLYRRIRSHTN